MSVLPDGHGRAQEIAGAALARCSDRGAGPVLVAIDGAGGSGKTSLAGAVAGLLDGCVVVHGDDFYRLMPEHERAQLDAEAGYHRYFDWQRLRDQVLTPLRTGPATRYQLYDWIAGELGAWQEIAAPPFVIVEGVYTARPELASSYHLTVFVDTPRETCLRRLRARSQNSDEWILRWRAAEDHYLCTTCPQNRVDLVVQGH